MEGGSEYWLTRFLFQRGLGVIYFCAFLGVVNQFRPLLGERGLLPAPRFLRRLRFRDAPSLFRCCPNDRAFAAGGWLGVFLALLAATGISERFGTTFSMFVWAFLWILYLSFVNIGQIFYGFGWESMLLESGFLAIFLGAAGTEPSAIIIWLLRWILFRVMLGAGLIKLRGDPCWKDFTCLFYHFETQPMPNPLSWYFHRLPARVHQAGVLFNHFVELIVPFFYFAPQPLAAAAGILTILFHGMLIVSGNFSWLNWLTVVLAVAAFDDSILTYVVPLTPPSLAPPALPHQLAIWGVLFLVLARSYQPVRNLLSRHQVMNTIYDPLHLVNSYGAFGSITRPRFEIVIEGTEDAVPATARWREYAFRGKPGRPGRRPPQVAPYHLRLDWLMWFAAMPSPYYPTWFVAFLGKLLAGDAAMLALLQTNPFPDAPPRHIRALYYQYRFTTAAERRQNGHWWHRELVGTYFPPVSLEDTEIRALLGRIGGDEEW